MASVLSRESKFVAAAGSPVLEVVHGYKRTHRIRAVSQTTGESRRQPVDIGRYEFEVLAKAYRATVNISGATKVTDHRAAMDMPTLDLSEQLTVSDPGAGLIWLYIDTLAMYPTSNPIPIAPATGPAENVPVIAIEVRPKWMHRVTNDPQAGSTWLVIVLRHKEDLPPPQ